jgi:hypothetical protein
VVEGAAAPVVSAVAHGKIGVPAGTSAVCVLGGGNLHPGQIRRMRWN